jgi:acetylglutamate synthase
MNPGNMGYASRVPQSPQTEANRPFHRLGTTTHPLSEVTIRKYTLEIRSSFDGLDKARITALLESSFGKKLVDPEAYFAAQNVIGVIIESDYRGMAIIKNLDGVAYLDKLAVTPELQGNGLGGALWQALSDGYTSLIWRAAKDNPINPWYAAVSSGQSEHSGWNIYWYGFAEPPSPALMQQIGEMQKTLVRTE